MKKLIICALIVAWCVPALADDFYPPPYRGRPLSYVAGWDTFLNGTFGTGIYTDSNSSVDDGDPATYLHTGFGTHLDFEGSGWQLTPPGGGGFHNPAKDANFAAQTINWVDWIPEKLLRVQVTYTDALGSGSPSIMYVIGYGPVSGGDPHTTSYLGRTDPDMKHFYEDFIIVPNPDWEQIAFHLPMGTIVEQIVIDSVSPEPATLSLLALGACLPLLRRRRRG